VRIALMRYAGHAYDIPSQFRYKFQIAQRPILIFPLSEVPGGKSGIELKSPENMHGTLRSTGYRVKPKS
jgi:hypothetical protein